MTSLLLAVCGARRLHKLTAMPLFGALLADQA